ncbi:MAG: tRNA uridine-5-carboxymethylaminomethyl(34) synthesis GTPase MnmE, partial [Candidatus Omnitrophica bacterium]|nr:tRNA uridine-5-carboxymethylaminomethyl(34) synthesis GTPase MnmE [Candidatus Omnitrophota bacterium]
MDHYNLNDTIAAISTASGKSAIGIVRLSGPEAVSIADKIFITKSSRPAKKFKSHTIHYGFIVEKQSDSLHPLPSSPEFIIDEVLLTVMRSPRTYTREDIVEINCHGGRVVLKKILELCIKNGARLANPGEFTLRAFLNGRIDLSQAEAVLNIIDARTEEYLKISARQLGGGLSSIIAGLKEKLLKVVSELEAVLDFPEEDIKESRKEDILKVLNGVKEKFRELIKHAKEGSILREGITGVICGEPNVGKSSLMNALLGEERVIVTPTPGTTRDVVEEIIDLDGIPLRIADTAGIIDTKDLVEKEGVRRAKNKISEADLLILVLDASRGITQRRISLFEHFKGRNCIACVNKIDLAENVDISKLEK